MVHEGMMKIRLGGKKIYEYVCRYVLVGTQFTNRRET